MLNGAGPGIVDGLEGTPYVAELYDAINGHRKCSDKHDRNGNYGRVDHARKDRKNEER